MILYMEIHEAWKKKMKQVIYFKNTNTTDNSPKTMVTTWNPQEVKGD